MVSLLLSQRRHHLRDSRRKGSVPFQPFPAGSRGHERESQQLGSGSLASLIHYRPFRPSWIGPQNLRPWPFGHTSRAQQPPLSQASTPWVCLGLRSASSGCQLVV
jgi:hypothetical protein